MVVMLGYGAYKAIDGIAPRPLHLRPHVRAPSPSDGRRPPGQRRCSTGPACLPVLRAFASGGSALTGTEAISNGVSIFRRPESRNARITMVCMAADPRLPGARGLLPGRHHPSRAVRVGHPDGHLPDRQVRLRLPRLRQRLLRAAADRHHPDPDPGRQHQLHRLPVPGQLRRRGLLPAPPADQAGPPPGLLHRDHRPHRGVDRPAAGHPGPGRQADPPLRHRRVHRLHHGRGRAWPSTTGATGRTTGAGAWASTAPPRSCRSSSW